MADEVTIPLLPCRSIDDVLDFYRALGFDVTYQQAKPNNYAVVQRGGIELHFFSMREYDPAASYSTCYVRVLDVDTLYRAFTDGLRQKYGRLPSAGIPRIIPLKNKSGRREFIAVDPGGNWIRIGQMIDAPASEDAPSKAPLSKFARALQAAELLAESKGDYAAAAERLDAVLAQDEPVSPTERIPALVLRANLAVTMGVPALARQLLDDLRRIPLSAAEREALRDEFEKAADLEHLLR